jgi:hypothetical protein
VAEEWRVSLIFDRGARMGAGSHRKRVRDLLRSRLSHDIKLSAKENRVFLYATASWAAEEAYQMARIVLAEQNLSAQVRIDYWDPAIGDWRDPDSTSQEAAPQESPAPGEQRADQTWLFWSVIDAVAPTLPF